MCSSGSSGTTHSNVPCASWMQWLSAPYCKRSGAPWCSEPARLSDAVSGTSDHCQNPRTSLTF
eukprot:4421301-Prymnesium_polylepis.1